MFIFLSQESGVALFRQTRVDVDHVLAGFCLLSWIAPCLTPPSKDNRRKVTYQLRNIVTSALVDVYALS